jgi:hypothetical protein
VEYVAPICLLVGSCLDIDSVETMAAFSEKIKSDHIALEESIHKRNEVGAAVDIAGEGSNSQIDLCRKDGEKTIVKCNDRIKVHRPELRCHLEDIISRQVYACVSTGGPRKET